MSVGIENLPGPDSGFRKQFGWLTLMRPGSSGVVANCKNYRYGSIHPVQLGEEGGGTAGTRGTGLHSLIVLC